MRPKRHMQKRAGLFSHKTAIRHDRLTVLHNQPKYQIFVPTADKNVQQALDIANNGDIITSKGDSNANYWKEKQLSAYRRAWVRYMK